MWIYEQAEWPHFSWDHQEMTALLGEVRHRAGLLRGRIESSPVDLHNEAHIETVSHDVLASSAIEGYTLNSDDVTSSVRSALRGEKGNVSRDVSGIVSMMVDATSNYSRPLTSQRLFQWHTNLFDDTDNTITVGNWRDDETGPMRVISGPVGKHRIHFVAPPAATLANETDRFLTWFNSPKTSDPVVDSGLAHFWFVTLHPFDDGNGRIARAIGDMGLARAEQSRNRYYSVSTQILQDRSQYYRVLESQQRSGLDVTQWLEWYLGCVGRSIDRAHETLNKVMAAKRIFDHLAHNPVSSRQHAIISRMAQPDFVGHMNTSKYAKMARCSSDTALRDIRQLVAKNILLPNEAGGRSTSYRLNVRL
jgi:Fic family protein